LRLRFVDPENLELPVASQKLSRLGANEINLRVQFAGRTAPDFFEPAQYQTSRQMSVTPSYKNDRRLGQISRPAASDSASSGNCATNSVVIVPDRKSGPEQRLRDGEGRCGLPKLDEIPMILGRVRKYSPAPRSVRRLPLG